MDISVTELHIGAAAIEKIMNRDGVAVRCGFGQIRPHVFLGDEGVGDHEWCLTSAHGGVNRRLTLGMRQRHLSRNPVIPAISAHKMLVGFEHCAESFC